MPKPLPTRQLVIDLCGGNQQLISSAHHGLHEASLRDFYPFLNLDEAIVFAASSWKSRDVDSSFRPFVRDTPDIYDIFNTVYGMGFPWLNAHKRISDRLHARYAASNPNGRNLRERLARVPQEAVQTLRERLLKKTRDYIFACDYEFRKRVNGGDTSNLEIMTFQPSFPRKERVIPAYASEIARIISAYPNP